MCNSAESLQNLATNLYSRSFALYSKSPTQEPLWNEISKLLTPVFHTELKEVHCQCYQSNAVTWCSQGGYISHSICFNDSANDFHPVFQSDQGYEGITWVFLQYFIVFKETKLHVTVGIYKKTSEILPLGMAKVQMWKCLNGDKKIEIYYPTSACSFQIFFFKKRDFSQGHLTVRVT